MTRTIIAALAGTAALAGAAPASAQYGRDYPPPPPPRTRTGEVASEVARTIRETADAIATVRDSVDGSLEPLRWSRAERFAIDACRPAVARYGAMRVDRVDPYGRRSLRVYGVAGGAAYGAYGSGYGSGGYGASGYPRTFACTVRDDGRVKLKASRVRYYR